MRNNLRVVFFNFFPMVNKNCPNTPEFHASNRCPMPGLAVEIIKLVADYLNMTIEVAHSGELEIHKYRPLLENGTVDLFALTFEKTTRRLEEFDFSVPLYDVSTKLAVKAVDNSMNKFFDFFKVYGIQIWILMGLAFFIFTIIGLLVRFVEYKLRLRQNLYIIEFLWKMLRLQLIQNEGGIDFRLLSGSISLLTFAFLQCSIIISLFQGWILTSVVKTKPPQPFQLENLPWLLEHKHYSFVTTELRNWYFEELNVSFQSPFYEYRNAIEKGNNPVIWKESDEDVFGAVHEGNKILVLQEDERISFKADQYCDFVYLPSPFPTTAKHFL